MVSSGTQSLAELDNMLKELQAMVPTSERPLPSPPLTFRPLPTIPSVAPSDSFENEYEAPPGPINFPSPPPLSPSKEGYVEPNPLDLLEQQMAALEALKDKCPPQSSPSKLYAKPSNEMKQKKTPPTIVQRKPNSSTKPTPPKFPPNQEPAAYLEAKLIPSMVPGSAPVAHKHEGNDLSQLDKLLDSLNDINTDRNTTFGIASLSYDHLSKEPGDRYETVRDTTHTSSNYDYPVIDRAQKHNPSQQEQDYAYPEVTSSHKDVSEHFYEAIPQDRRNVPKTKRSEPTPYMEVSPPSTRPKFYGKAPPRPSFKPNEKANERLQGLNDLVASLEDIKPSATSKPTSKPSNPYPTKPNEKGNERLQGLNDLVASLEDIKPSATSKPTSKPSNPHPTKPSKPPNTTEEPTSYLTHHESTLVSAGDSLLTVADDELGELDTMVGTLQKDANKQGLDTKSQGTCAACKMPILGKALTAINKQWHVDHFVCTACDTPLAHMTFFEHNEQPYCDKDHQELFSPKCAYCNGSILDQLTTALNQTWHPEHFFCAQCGKSFGEDGFHEHNGKPYCTEDYFDMFAPRCRACGIAIMEGYISAMGTQWHPECFVCKVCHVPFKGGNIFELEGRPYCELHYHAARGTLCASCLKPVLGACVTALGKKYHPDHFKCAFCMTELNKGTFKEHQNKPYCHPCFIKLFG